MMLEIIGRNMTMHMVDSYQRDIARVCDALSRSHTDQQSTHESRPISHSYQIYIACTDAGLFKSAVNAVIDLLKMPARSDLRNDSSELRMYAYLRTNNITEDHASVGNNTYRCLIAAGLYSKCKKLSVFHTVSMSTSRSPVPSMASSGDISLSMRTASSLLSA